MSNLILHAPAKVNLSLRVLRRRDDGFHEIDTTMVKVPGLSDRLEFHEAASFSFHCEEPGVPGDESNLVVRAVKAYEESAGTPCRFRVILKKSIPHGAGLGGGSSDAATTLQGLDKLHGDKLGEARLLEIAASLGSDIPFFLANGAARCTGRGEVVTTVPSPPAMRILLLKPWFSVPTADAYSRWVEAGELPGVDYSAREIGGVSLLNDLERPVFAKHRFLAELKQWLLDRDEVSAALLCGSGSTMFAVLGDGSDGEALAKCARDELDPGLWHWTGRTGT